jgi:hypothetical protein
MLLRLKLSAFTCRRRPPRRGLSSVEMIVSFMLLGSVLALFVPLVVRHGRLLVSHRQYRVGLDEVTNQLERLSVLSEQDLQAAIKDLNPSPLTAERLPGATLHAELQDADIGKRLTIQLTWNEPRRREAPITMSAWIMPSADLSIDQPDGSPNP